jgi:hypothetical protein
MTCPAKTEEDTSASWSSFQKKLSQQPGRSTLIFNIEIKINLLQMMSKSLEMYFDNDDHLTN